METIEKAKNRLEITMDGKNGFYRGVLWAQRWIPVEEEQPEHSMSIIFKNELGVYSVVAKLNMYWLEKRDGKYYYASFCFTHWRPIEHQ